MGEGHRSSSDQLVAYIFYVKTNIQCASIFIGCCADRLRNHHPTAGNVRFVSMSATDTKQAVFVRPMIRRALAVALLSLSFECHARAVLSVITARTGRSTMYCKVHTCDTLGRFRFETGIIARYGDSLQRHAVQTRLYVDVCMISIETLSVLRSETPRIQTHCTLYTSCSFVVSPMAHSLACRAPYSRSTRYVSGAPLAWGFRSP